MDIGPIHACLGERCYCKPGNEHLYKKPSAEELVAWHQKLREFCEYANAYEATLATRSQEEGK